MIKQTEKTNITDRIKGTMFALLNGFFSVKKNNSRALRQITKMVIKRDNVSENRYTLRRFLAILYHVFIAYTFNCFKVFITNFFA